MLCYNLQPYSFFRVPPVPPQTLFNTISTVLHWSCSLQDRKRYRGFSRRVTDLLMPSYPGSLPSIARNLFNAVFVVDLASPHGIG